MSTQGSALSNILKKSLDMNWTMSEAWDWNAVAKTLREEYDKLVRLHDEIQAELKGEWAGLAGKYDELVADMRALENKQVRASDPERKAYTKKVLALIARGTDLQKEIRAEPERLRTASLVQAAYQERAPRIDDLLRYTATHQLQKEPNFSQLKQAKEWISSATGPTPNQINSIIKTIDAVDAAIVKRNEAAEEKRQQDLAETQRLQKLKEQEEERSNQATLKSKQQQSEREAKAAPVKDLLDDAMSSVEAEKKEYTALQDRISKIESKLGDKKLAVLKGNLEQVKKRIETQNRQLLTNKDYPLLAPKAPGWSALQEALQSAVDHFDGLSVPELDTLRRDLDKVLANMDALADNRSGFEDALQSADPDLIAKKERNPRVRAYVFANELPIANTDLSDVVGILGGERRGRTSPNGRTNHLHVGGNAQNNALFDWNGPDGAVRLLGFVDGHMDRRASPTVLAQAENVERRASGTFTEVEVDVVARTLRPV